MSVDKRILRYIPKKTQPHIIDCYRDSDGYWAVCEKGYHFGNTDCHTAHGETLRDFLDDIRSFVQIDYNSDWD